MTVEIYPEKDGCYPIPDLDETDGEESSEQQPGCLGRLFRSGTSQSPPEVSVSRAFILQPVDDEQSMHFTKQQRQQLKTLAERGNVTPEEFYRAQSYQQLGQEEDRFDVPVWIDPVLSDDWKRWLDHGIAKINTAAPGLHLYTVTLQDDAIIVVTENTNSRAASTSGNVLENAIARIRLGRDWSNKERTATHEMLHALCFKHEHQRPDAGNSIQVASDNVIRAAGKKPSQIRPKDNILGISRFDPHSIMSYFESNSTFKRNKHDPAWEGKDKQLNNQMSELDKVGLNLLYRPCKSPYYNPVISPQTGLMYCGREVMSQHNTPHDPVTTRCGPETGPNCPACRTLNTSRVQKKILNKDKWQGWSGLVYCGHPIMETSRGCCGLCCVRSVETGRLCGQNSGESCQECKRLLKI